MTSRRIHPAWWVAAAAFLTSIGVAIAAGLAGLVRDQLGNYDLAWYVASVLCVAAAAMCLSLWARPATLILTSG